MPAYMDLHFYKSGTAMRGSQHGVVLFIALIVLLAMTLAGIGLMRSVTTGNLVAGNLAFKMATINAAEPAIQSAFSYLQSKAGTAYLNVDHPSEGYFSSQGATTNWNNDSAWANSFPSNPVADAAGNTVTYLIHRMCETAGVAYNDPSNQCSLAVSNTQGTGTSKTIPPRVYNSKPLIYFRISARVQGPRNTQSVIQSLVLIPD